MTEAELVKLCLSKDHTSQKHLFEMYSSKMMSVCLRFAGNRHDAQEILQIGFIQVFASLHQFKNEGSLEGWIRTLMVRVAIRYIRKKKLTFTDLDEEKNDVAVIDPFVDIKISIDEIHAYIRKLPAGYRLVFNLNVIEGYTHDEIAKMLDIQATTSRTQLLKARKMLQTMILNEQKKVAI